MSASRSILVVAIVLASCRQPSSSNILSTPQRADCSPATIAKLQADLAALKAQQQPASDGALSQETIVRDLTLDYSLSQHAILKVIQGDPNSPTWASEVTSACAPYAKGRADRECKANNNCKTMFGYPSAAYEQSLKDAQMYCESKLQIYVKNRKPSLKLLSESDAMPPAPVAPGDDDAKPDSPATPQQTPPPAAAAQPNAGVEQQIKQIEARLAACQAASNPQAAAGGAAAPACMCEKRGNQCAKIIDGKVAATLTPIGRETCGPAGSGGYQNLCNQPQLKCSANSSGALAPGSTAATSQVKPSTDSNPAAPTTAADTPASQDALPSDSGGACKCEKSGNQCAKMVDGKVVASLTMMFNSQIGKQEICDASGAGGYENLCNQPQLKCSR